MNEIDVNYKLLKRIKDEKFNVDHLENYTLLIQLGIRDVQVSVIDSAENHCLTLEDYVLNNISSASDWRLAIQEVFDNHHYLKAGFWKNVRISVKNTKFSHVPAALFIQEAIHDYLSINCRFNSESEVALYYRSLKTDVVTCFALDKQLYFWLNELYPNAHVGYVHQSAALIEGVTHYDRSHRNITMYLYIDRFKLHILTLKKGSLEYYNQFTIKQFSEYIRYIMLAVQGLKQDQAKSNVVMWGYLGKKSPHYNEFYKYIQSISFGDRPDYLKYGFLFDEVQDHHFFDLYSCYLCE